MKIKRKLQLNLYLAVLVVILVSFGKYHQVRHIQEYRNEISHVVGFSVKIYDWSDISHEYLLYRSVRAERQWIFQYGEVLRNLRTLNKQKLVDNEFYSQAILNIERSKTIFEKLTVIDENPSFKNNAKTRVQVNKRLATQLLVSSKELHSKVLQLVKITQDRELVEQKRESLAFVIMFTLLASFVVVVSCWVSASIYPALAHLKKVFASVAGGDTALRSKIAREDEFGDISRNFDEMLDSLSAITVSRDKLNEEVEERKKIEESLRNSEQKYRTVTDNVTDVVWTQNMAGDFTFLSPSWETLTGFTVAEGLAMNNRDILTPDSYSHAIKTLGQRLETDGKRKGKDYPSFVIELEHIRKDGSRFYCEVTAKFLRDRNGDPTGLTGVTRDITERKQAEDKIQQQKYNLERAQELGQIGTWELDLRQNRLYWTDENCRIFGVPSGSVVNYELFLGKVHPDDREYVDREWHAALKGKPYDIEHRVAVGDNMRWVREKADLEFNEEGVAVNAIGFTQDITERKQAEEERLRLEKHLRQAQKMEAIGVLAGGIAHDFNNILSIMLGYTDMAKEDAPPDSRLAKDLDRVLQAGHRAKDLVKQILSFSRQAQIEKMVLKPQPIIKEALKMLRASIPATIAIQEEISPACGTIYADPTQLHQILMNLCTNAFHAMEAKGGVLRVNLQDADSVPVELPAGNGGEEGAFMELSVSDTGIGIGPDVIGNIFDPFFTTKERGKGTGMGLAIIYGVVKDYGGTITVDSQLGKGTTFHVYLPQSKQDTALPPAKEAAVKGGKERILFVDDEELLASMGKEMLERLGYHVTSRQSSLEALEAFQNQPDIFDLVITDQTMPGMTGIDMSRRMLQIRPDIPIILCTGYSSLVDEEVARAQGIKGFALKPLAKGAMAKLIRQILDREEPLD